MPAYSLRWADQYTEPYIESAEELEQRKTQLNKEIDACVEADPVARSKLKRFLLDKGIGGIAEMNYPLRASYEEFLETEVKDSRRYLRAFDQIKRHSIKGEMKTLAGRQRCQWKYENVVLYLPYHSDEEVAEKFIDARQQEMLVWDFSRECSEKMKRQIFEVLNCFISDMQDRNARRQRLLGLQELYRYCADKNILDIELLEQSQIDDFLKRLTESKAGNVVAAKGNTIVNQCRKIIFMNSEEINWQANVWYLERLHLTPGRIDPSKSKDSVSFLDVGHSQNRAYLKEYMKYALGVTGQAYGTIYVRFRRIVAFLVSLEENNIEVTQCTERDVGRHINCVLEQHGDAKHFNEKVMGITHFFMFLGVRGYIQKVPFKAEYYLQKVIPTHNDRSVDETVWMEIIQKLPGFPEHLRCMFLHLWSIGLRASEICTLKGNAYYIQNGETWMQIYQQKMKKYKRIPIPEMLYKIMQVYIRRHQIKQEDYIFQNTKGGAFLYDTFRHQMIKECEKHGINNGDYLFKSHDYRHTIATLFYDNEVSIQSIRDYLGHNCEEMTRQYIDYMPRKLAKASDEFFSKPWHSLAACLKEGGSFGKQ